MWVSRTHYETMFENLAKARQEVSDLKQRLAAMISTQDWLTQHVNRLELERRMLTEARIGMSFPVPIIEREDAPKPQPNERPVAPGIDPSTIRGVPHESIGISQLLAGSLEDVGDEQAEAMGITHDGDGFVNYKQ